MTFEMFRIAFEKRVIESKEETINEIIEIVLEKKPHLLKLSDSEIDRLINLLKAPEGYVIREIFAFLLENIQDIMSERADEIGEGCYDMFIELVNLGAKMDIETMNDPGSN